MQETFSAMKFLEEGQRLLGSGSGKAFEMKMFPIGEVMRPLSDIFRDKWQI